MQQYLEESEFILQVLLATMIIFLQPHRVLIPEEDTKKQAVRRSIAFFVQPDNNVLVECVDGSNKYPPITAQEDTRRRYNRTYN